MFISSKSCSLMQLSKNGAVKGQVTQSVVRHELKFSLLTQRRVDQDGVVQLGRRGGDVDGLHLLEGPQRVALAHQLRDGPLVQGAGDEQDDVVDHVAVGDEVEEGGQLAGGVVAHVLELGHQLLAQVVVDDRHLQRRRHGRQEVAIVRALQVQLQI